MGDCFVVSGVILLAFVLLLLYTPIIWFGWKTSAGFVCVNVHGTTPDRFVYIY